MKNQMDLRALNFCIHNNQYVLQELGFEKIFSS